MKRTIKRWTRALIRTNICTGLYQYGRFISDWRAYRKMAGAERIRLKDTYPCLFDNVPSFSPGSHYFYQDIWAFTKIYNSGVKLHVDVGSKADFVGFLTAITKVEFVDIRPLDAPYLKNFKCIKGSILDMPYESSSLNSISCLHVAEHIGLGRYGDQHHPLRKQKATTPLPTRLHQRSNSPEQILEYFDGLKLLEFSVYDDKKRFIENADPRSAENAKFACGMFWFTKE